MTGHITTWFSFAAITIGFLLADSGTVFADDEERDRNEQSQRDEGPRARYVQQIFAAAEALQELGRPEDARRLVEIAQQLRQDPPREDARREPQERRRERRDAEAQAPRERERDRERDRDRPERRRPDREGGERAERERERREQPDREREEHPEIRAAREQIAVLRIAMEALAEADRVKGANQIEQAIRAMQLAIEGRRDEARRVRQSAPSRGNQAEWLMLAQRILNEKEQNERARAVGQLAERLLGRRRSDRPARSERDVALHHLEIMRTALPALREAEREDAADILQRAIRAREVTLEGRGDDEADQIRKNAPPRNHVTEVLMLSSKLWREFNNPEKAESIAELAQHYQRRREGRDYDPRAVELQKIKARIRELASELEKLHSQLDRLTL